MQLVPISVDQLVGNMLGTYYVEQLLGHGNMSAVYLATQQVTNQKVMLTAFILPNTFSAQARELFKMRFSQEATSLTRLQHPHILPVNDFGDQYGYPYFVTPLVTSGSVAKLLKQRGRLTPEETLAILKQVAAALDYAHSCGMVHGSLKPVNLILDEQQKVWIAGFGLASMLKMQGIMESPLPHAHLLNIGGTFLGTAEYVAPEVVRGAPMDARADIYALGITLFELLSGHPPFTGEQPLEVARMHVLQAMPALQNVCPDLPLGLDLVVQRALESKPQQRIAPAEKLASAFERVIRVMKMGASNPSLVQNGMQMSTIDRDATVPPTVNWFEEELLFQSGQVQAVSPNPVPDNSGKLQRLTTSAHDAAVRPAKAPTSPLWKYVPEPVAEVEKLADERGIDPFEWWSTSIMARVNVPMVESGAFGTTAKAQPLSRLAIDKGRRKSIALIASGGVVAAGLLTVGAVSLAHLVQHNATTQTAKTQSPVNTPAQQSTTKGTTAQSAPAQAAATPTMQPTPTAQLAPTTQPTPAVQPTPTTAPPTPTLGHTGTVIGSTGMATNSAQTFGGGVLIRLSNGNFVAYSTSCTHEGARVVYDPGSKQLRCTRHSAAFDPANNARVLYGPPPAPQPQIAIMVNADGTITM